MAAKEQAEVPTALLQHQHVPASIHTLLGVVGICHNSLFCLSLFSYSSSLSASVHATFPVDSRGCEGVKVMSLLNSYQLKKQYTFKTFQLLLSSSPP